LTDSNDGTATEVVIKVSPAAIELVREVRANEGKPEELALWLEVSGSANGVYTYDLWFGPIGGIATGDACQFEGDLTIVVPAGSVDRVRGARLDVSEQAGEPGLVIVNANTPPPLSAHVRRADLSGPVAQTVLEVLNEQVNPQIAMHGGHADLVAVEGPVAYVEMSGGCQGCGMARATLSQGIAIAITDVVPEITEVVDVTDHVSGTNPYYEPARR